MYLSTEPLDTQSDRCHASVLLPFHSNVATTTEHSNRGMKKPAWVYSQCYLERMKRRDKSVLFCDTHHTLHSLQPDCVLLYVPAKTTLDQFVRRTQTITTAVNKVGKINCYFERSEKIAINRLKAD
jgi:hypothetical protein